MFVILCVLHFANSLPVIAAEETWQPRNRCQWSCDSDGNNLAGGYHWRFRLFLARHCIAHCL